MFSGSLFLLFITTSQSLFKLMSIELVMPSNHLILCHPLLLLPSIFPSTRVFSNESVLYIMWSKYWSFSFSTSSSSEYSGLISFRMDWFNILQSKWLSRAFSNTTVQKYQFFSAQPSLWSSSQHLYMTTRKTIALIIWTFVIKVMSLLFNMLSRLVIAFLPRRNHLLILWLQSLSAVILEPQKIKSVTVSIVSPSICYGDGTGCHDLSFFECWVLSHLFHSPLSHSSRGSSVPLCFLP